MLACKALLFQLLIPSDVGFRGLDLCIHSQWLQDRHACSCKSCGVLLNLKCGRIGRRRADAQCISSQHLQRGRHSDLAQCVQHVQDWAMSGLSLTSMTRSCRHLWHFTCVASTVLMAAEANEACMHGPSFDSSMLSGAKIAGRLTCVRLWPCKSSSGAEAVTAGCCLWLSCCSV